MSWFIADGTVIVTYSYGAACGYEYELILIVRKYLRTELVGTV